MTKKAVYAGSFDPITNGHLWIIQEGARLFDELVVAVGVAPDKEYAFSIDERLQMVKESTRRYPNVSVDSFERKFLINYAKSIGAKYILRGIRTEGDYEYERTMRHINSDLSTEIQTAFLIPPREIADLSSSLVKSLVGPEGWGEVIRKDVPSIVCRKLAERLKPPGETKFQGYKGG